MTLKKKMIEAFNEAIIEKMFSFAEDRNTNIINYIQKGKKKILISEIRANQTKSKNEDFIKLRKFLTKKWKNKYEEKDLILKNYDFLFLLSLDYYFKYIDENADDSEIVFQYVNHLKDREHIREKSFEELKSYFNNTIENIEKREKEFEEYREYKSDNYDEEPTKLCNTEREINLLRKQDYRESISIWEYYVKRKLETKKEWKIARENLVKKWEEKKKITLEDLHKKYKEFAILNDIYNRIHDYQLNDYSEFKSLSENIVNNITTEEILKLIEENK